MNSRITPGRVYGAVIVIATAWVLHGFVSSLLAATIAAIASWPLYERFSASLPASWRGTAGAALFTALITVFALAPMSFAAWALVSEVRSSLHELAAADVHAVPTWLRDLPLLGPWATAHWHSHLAHPEALLSATQAADSNTYMGWAQSLGRFAGRHALILLFSILLLFFAYGQGEAVARDFRRVLRHAIGERAERYTGVIVQATRASVASMVLVGLFDGVAAGVVLALAGAPHPAIWGGMVGAFAAIPFLGYAAIGALALRLAIQGQAALSFVCLALGCMVLLVGDKVVRPMVAREGMRLSFVWVLMGCIGGFEVLGLVGLVVGPVVLALARELWDQRVRTASPLRADPAGEDHARTESGPNADGSPTTSRARTPIVGDMHTAPMTAAHVERRKPVAASARR